ncbi:RNA-directed DNA polymerase, eukaryota, partial [Tanacetum coccineum]
MRNRNSCPLCRGTDHNKRTCTYMFKDQDEVVVAQDEVVQEKPDELYLDEQPIIKDVKEEDEHADEDVDSDDDEDDKDGDITTGSYIFFMWWSGKQSRSQKKSRKAMLKLGMKAVLGVSRVTIKRTKNVSSCCILSRPKELQVPSGSVSLLQWVGSFVGNMIALSLRPRISSKNSIPQAGLTGVADSVAVNDSATCDTSPVGCQRATAGFAPAILSNPVDVIKDRVMKGPETLIGLAFVAQAIFNCLKNLSESNYVEGFNKFVEDTWSESPGVDSNAMCSMAMKLKHLKLKIREWNKGNMKDMKSGKAKYKEDLEALDAAIDNGDGSVETVTKRMEVVKSLQDINKLQAMEMAQKAKIKWSIEGDENSSFFHGMLNKRRSQLSIRGIMVDGVWIEDPYTVKREFYQHFSKRFDKPMEKR